MALVVQEPGKEMDTEDQVHESAVNVHAADGKEESPLSDGPVAAEALEEWKPTSAAAKVDTSQFDPSVSPTSMSWSDLKFSVPSKKEEGGRKKILKGVSGEVRPGRLCAIMGPSGAGKSTLLNCLAGRISGKNVTGTIMVNGRKVDPVKFRRRIAYVMQEDSLFATATVKEAFTFSARLRLPASTTAAERSQVVEDMLEKLMLRKCENTMVGNIMIRGVSGGEKKRTAIGVELISNPTVLFLDEPTSGLDSYAAHTVVTILKGLARGGRTIITTIHQPSSEVFSIFDDVLLIADGETIYHDAVKGMVPYFAGRGHACPSLYNPADFVMFLMQTASKDARKALAAQWNKAAAEEYQALADRSAKGGGGGGSETGGSGGFGDDAAPRPGCCTQMWYLGIRELRNTVRDKGSLIANTGGTLFLFLVVAAVFYCGASYNNISFDASNAGGDGPCDDMKQGYEGAISGLMSAWPNNTGTSPPQNLVPQGPEDQGGIAGATIAAIQGKLNVKINNHFGSIVQVSIGGLFGLAQPMILGFPLQRPVFIREYATGTYNAVPYFLSKFMTELPTMLVSATMIYLATYWLVGFQGNFAYLILSTAMLGMVSASYALAIGSLANNVQVAIQFVPLLFVPQLLFGGLFIAIEDIPIFLRWAQYLCSLKYSINIMTTIEMQDPPRDLSFLELDGELINNRTVLDKMYNNIVYGCPDVTDHACVGLPAGEQPNSFALFPRTDIEPNMYWRDLAVLGAIFVGFRVFSCLVLSYKASSA